MRLIDADALFEKGVILIPAKYYEGAQIVINAIRNAPTIEAEPIVRCKDCKWHEAEQPGMVYCPAVVGGWVEDAWFCKGGERKDEVAE